LAKLPPLKLEYSDEIERTLPDLTGAITVALAKVFKTVNPDLKNPQSEDWEKAINIFRILV